MRNREGRLSWIEDLFRSEHAESEHPKGIVIASPGGLLCVAFSSVVEVTSAASLKALSFLPEAFCGVIDRGNSLAPVIDVCSSAATGHAKVLLMSEGIYELGLRYAGSPHVIDLDECSAERGLNVALPFPFAATATLATPYGSAALLDVTAVALRLLGDD